MKNLLVNFEPIFIFIFTCKCNLHVCFYFCLVAKISLGKKIWATKKNKNVYVIMK